MVKLFRKKRVVDPAPYFEKTRIHIVLKKPGSAPVFLIRSQIGSNGTGYVFFLGRFQIKFCFKGLDSHPIVLIGQIWIQLFFLSMIQIGAISARIRKLLKTVWNL